MSGKYDRATVRVDSGETSRTRLARMVFGEDLVRVAELREYVDIRYDDLQEKIRDADVDSYEDKLNVLAWKGQQEELVRLLEHFEGGRRE